MIILDDIISLTENLKKLRDFIEGDLSAILGAFAETEYQAAADALQNIHLAKNRKAMVWQAVGHLQSAHAAFHRSHSEGSGWKDMARMATRMAAIHKDLFTMCLMAICYRYLAETNLMEKTLADAVELLNGDLYEKTYTLGELVDPKRLKEFTHDIFSAVASWVNPGSYPIMLQQAQGRFPAVRREDLEHLCKALKYHPIISLS